MLTHPNGQYKKKITYLILPQILSEKFLSFRKKQSSQGQTRIFQNSNFHWQQILVLFLEVTYHLKNKVYQIYNSD